MVKTETGTDAAGFRRQRIESSQVFQVKSFFGSRFQCFHATADYLSWQGSLAETSTSDSILIPRSSLETAFHLPLTKPLNPWRRGARQHHRLSRGIHKRIQILGRSAAYLQLADAFLPTAWLIFLFVSLCHLFTLSRASLPVFNGWAKQWRKEGWGRRTEGGWGLPSPGRALMKSLWSWVWLNSLRKRRGAAPLQGWAVIPFLFTFSSHLFPFDFLSLVCQFQARSLPPPSPCSYNRPSFHLLSSSLIRTWIMSLLN